MSTIQQQMQIYHALETVLRGAADTQQPMTLGDIWEVSSVRQSAPKITHVRDKLKVLLHHKLVSKLPVAESASGNKMARVGYMWNAPGKSVDTEIKFRNSSTQEGHGWPDVDLRKPQVKKEEPAPIQEHGVDIYFEGCIIHGGKNVELYISDVKCIVSKNPSGKVIIEIE